MLMRWLSRQSLQAFSFAITKTLIIGKWMSSGFPLWYSGLDALTLALSVDTLAPLHAALNSGCKFNLCSKLSPALFLCGFHCNLLHFLFGKILVSIIQGMLHLSRNYRRWNGLVGLPVLGEKKKRRGRWYFCELFIQCFSESKVLF